MLSLVSLYWYKLLAFKVLALIVINHANVSRIVLMKVLCLKMFFCVCKAIIIIIIIIVTIKRM